MKAPVFGNAEHDAEVMHEGKDAEEPLTIFDHIGKGLGIVMCIVLAYGIITAF